MLRSVTKIHTFDPGFSRGPAARYPCRPVGTEKRERQKSARLLKIEAEQHAARRARRKRTTLRLVVTAVVVVAGVFAYSTIWGDDDDTEAATDVGDESTTTVPETTTTTYSNPQLAEEVLAREAPDPEPPPADTAPDALEITTLIEGEGEGVANGDSIVAHYIGKTSDGNVFDESWSRGQPFGPLAVGSGQVIVGWDEGLIGAKIGERRRLVIGSEKAYGASGSGDIPPNAPLAFEIDIVDVVKAG